MAKRSVALGNQIGRIVKRPARADYKKVDLPLQGEKYIFNLGFQPKLTLK
jgi:hypothetical protein